MRKFMHFFGAMLLLSACNNKPEVKVESAATEEEKVEYAYTIEHPDNWVPGSKQNTKIALQSLKDWENGKVEASAQSFGDSVSLSFNAFEAKVPRDSAIKLLQQERKNYKAVTIEMNDWESVISKDGKEEYVSLWYKQKYESQDGKWDSVSVMDDLKIKDGKIISIDEKTRTYAKKQ